MRDDTDDYELHEWTTPKSWIAAYGMKTKLLEAADCLRNAPSNKDVAEAKRLVDMVKLDLDALVAEVV